MGLLAGIDRNVHGQPGHRGHRRIDYAHLPAVDVVRTHRTTRLPTVDGIVLPGGRLVR